MPSGREPATILVVDDDPEGREAIAELLEAEGFRVVALASAERALAHLRENTTPNLIISDVFMPGLNGWELMRELAVRPRFTLVPVMVVTGCPDHEGAPAAEEWIFTKPVDPERLLAAVRSALRESSWATAHAA
jgi:CheY-like chemotaxis protein